MSEEKTFEQMKSFSIILNSGMVRREWIEGKVLSDEDIAIQYAIFRGENNE